jgi:hypothetical protein
MKIILFLVLITSTCFAKDVCLVRSHTKFNATSVDCSDASDATALSLSGNPANALKLALSKGYEIKMATPGGSAVEYLLTK